MSGVTEEMVEAAFHNVPLQCIVSAVCAREIIKAAYPIIMEHAADELERLARVNPHIMLTTDIDLSRLGEASPMEVAPTSTNPAMTLRAAAAALRKMKG